jgi:hypothetical protein
MRRDGLVKFGGSTLADLDITAWLGHRERLEDRQQHFQAERL